jgi:predicted regulator of Ras-like GTPase activity (Roadblock/LC7/MglB family)
VIDETASASRVGRRGAVRPGFATDFGNALADLIAAVPGAIGAVLCDQTGESIDFAHDPRAIAEIDVQIAGAQVIQTVMRTDDGARRLRLGDVDVLVEASHGALLATPLHREYALVLVLAAHANVARALAAFPAARERIGVLLR